LSDEFLCESTCCDYYLFVSVSVNSRFIRRIIAKHLMHCVQYNEKIKVFKSERKLYKPVRYVCCIEEVAYAAGESWIRCADHKHFVELRWRLDVAQYAATSARLSSRRSPSNSRSAETLRIYPTASTRLDCL